MSVRNLELILDNTLGTEKQVNFIIKSCYYQIRNIGPIRKYINYNIHLSLTNRLQEHITQITGHDPVSYIQSTEWNSTTVCELSDRKIYTSENAPIRVLVWREILPSISSQDVERVVKPH